MLAIEESIKITDERDMLYEKLKALNLSLVEETEHPIHREIVNLTVKMSALKDDIKKEVLGQESDEKILEAYNRLGTSVIKYSLFKELLRRGIIID